MRMIKKDVNRPKLMRLLALDEAIRAGRYPNCTSFAQEYEVSYKSIQRDIEWLRDMVGAPLEFDRSRNGYYYTDTAWHMPGLELTEGELLSLLLLTRVTELFKDTTLETDIRSLAEKMQMTQHGSNIVDPALFQQYFSFLPMPSRPVSREIWGALFQAVRQRHAVQLLYASPQRPKPRHRVVEPLHLACIGEEWYLAAYDRPSEEIRNFALSRIRAVNDTGEVYEPVEFDPKTYYANRFGRFIGKPGESVPVKIWFSKDAARWIEERKWHPEQKIQRRKDGSVVLSFPAPSLYEVRRFVSEWAPDAKLLEPSEISP